MAQPAVPAPDLDSLLMACLSNNTEAIKAAEAALKKLTGSPALMPELLARAAGHPSPEVRQLAAVLLRKAVTKHWTKLGEQDRAHVQAVLLERLVAEPTHPVRKSLGHLVGVVARHAVPRAEWPGLLEFLGRCAASGEAGHREVALSLLGSLAEHVGEHLAPHVASLLAVVGAGLRDPAPDVVRAAVRCLEPLAGLVAGRPAAGVEAFHGLVAALMEVAAAAHAASPQDDETLVAALQLFVELCEASAPLLGKHLPAVVALAMRVGTDPGTELSTREAALEVVHWIARFKPKQLGRNKELVRQVVTALCAMAAQPPPPDLDPEDDGVLPPSKMATQALDAVALHVPPAAVFPPVMAFAREALAAPQPGARDAGLTCLAVIFEGCREPLRKRLKDVVPLLLSGLRDGEASVRGAAAFALGMAAEFLQPEIVEHYKEVLPLLFPLMAEGNADVCERTCYALDTFCEALEGPEIVPYLHQLVGGLGAVLGCSGPPVQELALSALASVVAAAGKEFEPYLGSVLPALHPFMSSSAPALAACRCRATETAGLLFEALGGPGGSAQLRALAGPLMELGLQGFKLDSSELREYGHGLFSCIAKSLAADFAPFLPHCVPLALESIAQDDGVFGDDDDEDEEEEDDEDEEEEDNRRAQQLSIRTGVLDEKCAATSALGLFAQACPAAFTPYLEPTLAAFTKQPGGMCRYFHEEVRVQAAEALPRLVLSVYAACPPPPGAAGAAAVLPPVRAVLDVACKELTRALEDSDAAVVAAALQGLTALLRQLGPEPLGGAVLGALSGAVTAVFKSEAPCQAYLDDEDDDGGDDDEEGGGGAAAEEELFTAAVDCMPAFAAAGGADAYAPVFASQHLPALVARLRLPHQPPDLRGVLVGGIAEAAEVLKAHLTPHLGDLLPLLLRELRCSEPINRQNAAFAAGVLAAGCGGAAMAPHLPKLLQALHPLFAATENDGVRDNALGCVARLLTAAADPAAPPPAGPSAAAAGLLPLEAVLPVFLGALPLREDLSEAGAVYGALCALMTGDLAQRIAPLVPQIVSAFGAAAVQQPPLPAAVVGQVAATLAAVAAQYPGPMGPLVAALPDDQKAALQAAAAAAGAAPS